MSKNQAKFHAEKKRMRNLATAGPSIVLDTGALSRLENGEQKMVTTVKAALAASRLVRAPLAILVEWWTGHHAQDTAIKKYPIDWGDIDLETAKLAATTLRDLQKEISTSRQELKKEQIAVAKAKGRAASTLDAILVAFARKHKGVVYTCDVDDINPLAAKLDVKVFPA